jgi:transcriptional regulator with XRE-family HTH domain
MKNIEIGIYLKQYRIRRNLSQAEVAKALNYSQQTIAKWENSVSSPDPANLCKLADLYQVSLDELLRHPIVKESTTPYYTKKDVVEEWINSIGFKTAFELHELNKTQTQHLMSQIINQINLFKDTINYNDSEQ